MFTSHEYSDGILYDRWYNEVEEEKCAVEMAGHIIRQDIHGNRTYPEQTSITFTFTSLESLYTIVYNVSCHGCKKEHGSHHEATILDLGSLSSNIRWRCYT